MTDSEDVTQWPLMVCYCDFDELCSITTALRLPQRKTPSRWPRALPLKCRARVALPGGPNATDARR